MCETSISAYLSLMLLFVKYDIKDDVVKIPVGRSPWSLYSHFGVEFLSEE